MKCAWPTLDGPYRKAMAGLGACVGRRPLPFLLLPALVSLALAYPFLRGISEYRRLALTRAGAIEYFTPSRSRAEMDRKRLMRAFPDGGYFKDRTAVSPGLFIILVSPGSPGGSVLDDVFVNEYRVLRAWVENIGVRGESGPITIRSLCQSSSPTNQSSSLASTFTEHCQSDAFLTLWALHRSGLLPAFTYPYVHFETGPDPPSSVYVGPLFGGVVTDPAGVIRRAEYVRMIFRLPVDERADTGLIDRLGVNFSEHLDEYRSEGLSIRYWVSQKYARDMQLIGKRVVRLLPLLIVLLLALALLMCCMKDCVLSKPWLAVAGLLSAGLGLQVGFAFLFVLGADLIEIAMIVPFLVLSIGLDDTFVMLNVWRSSDLGWSVEKRMSMVFEEAAVSITITSLTDVAAFLIGWFSVFPAVQIFCSFCASALFAVFLYQLTFFGACMTYTGRMEAQGRHCLLLVKANTNKDADEETLLGRIFCSTAVSDSPSSSVLPRPWPVTFFKTRFAGWLRLRWVKVGVGVSYALYLTSSVFLVVTNLKQGLRVSSLVPYDSSTHDYLTLYETHFAKFSTSAEVLLLPSQPTQCHTDADYARRDVQRALIDWALSFENTAYTSNVDFWLYQYWLYRRGYQDDTEEYDEENDANLVEYLRDEFLSRSAYRKYSDHMTFDRCPQGGLYVNASRFYVQLANMGFQNRSAAMHLLRKKTEETPGGFSAYVYDVSFPLAEQYDAVLPGVIYDVAVGVGCMLAVACLFVPNLITCLCIAFTVFSINVGVLGYMAVWRVNLDIISTITILLSIGFSVDYTSHVAYHFYVSGREDPSTNNDRKVAKALETAAWPILQSSLSMMVGVVTVLGVRAYIADTFVKTVLLVMLIGVYHALIVLPVLLSVLSPNIRTSRVAPVQTSPDPKAIPNECGSRRTRSGRP